MEEVGALVLPWGPSQQSRLPLPLEEWWGEARRKEGSYLEVVMASGEFVQEEGSAMCDSSVLSLRELQGGVSLL